MGVAHLCHPLGGHLLLSPTAPSPSLRPHRARSPTFRSSMIYEASESTLNTIVLDIDPAGPALPLPCRELFGRGKTWLGEFNVVGAATSPSSFFDRFSHSTRSTTPVRLSVMPS